MSIQQIAQQQAELEKQRIKEEENNKTYASPPDDPSVTLNIKKIEGVESGALKKKETNAEKNLRIISNSKVDFDFIKELEGYTLEGVIPDAENSNSGVTVASGFDLGQRNLNDLKGLPKNLKDKLTKYLGYKGTEAENQLRRFPLNITEEEASILNKKAKEETIINLYNSWYDATGQSFNDLDQGQQTAVASVAFQYGDLPSRTPNFWFKATEGRWDFVYDELMNFKDRYSTRRQKEAAYLQNYIEPILSNPLISKVSKVEGRRN